MRRTAPKAFDMPIVLSTVGAALAALLIEPQSARAPVSLEPA